MLLRDRMLLRCGSSLPGNFGLVAGAPHATCPSIIGCKAFAARAGLKSAAQEHPALQTGACEWLASVSQRPLNGLSTASQRPLNGLRGPDSRGFAGRIGGFSKNSCKNRLVSCVAPMLGAESSFPEGDRKWLQ